MLGMATLMAAIVAPLQLIVGDMHGLNTLEHQPLKVAAMEGIWETSKGADLRLFAIPNEKEERNTYEILIPKLASIILTHRKDGEVKGLKEWKKEERPPIAPVFFAFRIMVGIGFLMIGLGMVSVVQYVRKRLFDAKWVHVLWITMMPSGFIALLMGWFVTEIGRQPYSVYGVFKTAKSVSPAITGPEVAWSLMTFIVLYTMIFSAASVYIVKMIRSGIKDVSASEQFKGIGIEASMVDAATKKI